jgi:hypothetical protein
MRLPRLSACGLGVLTWALAYSLMSFSSNFSPLAYLLLLLGSIIAILSIIPVKRSRWRVFSGAFILYGVAMGVCSIAAAVLRIPFGFDLFIFLVGTMSAGGWLATQRTQRRHRIARMKANYFQEL